MDLIWGHIAPEPMSCPELKNIGLTLWVIQKISVWLSRHVLMIRYYAVHLQEALLGDSYELHTENMCSNPCPPQAAPSLWIGRVF